ncbi:DNA repair protein RecO [Kineococcus radiotolerans]|uniref:DNA repair protein RecO n=1 Tax=Kineococcus radiotolerans (strain ATCC BAA-149 / DSM 14245 / SRS30216) TaxID=266940 RepID=A6WDF0_KINRD|nr:DNA repair protein RecO [Kineococcus radiotolerans]ABS04839.1 DNA repair protein RecO [Kineococcus radiotolerans SRS30216 = ATCC BAA-149]
MSGTGSRGTRGSSIGGAKSYRDEAVVLRTAKLGEADRIVSLLTRHHGRVRAVAKGVRRTSSRFGARLEPFTCVDVQLHRGRSLDTVTQADVLAPYGQVLVADYGLYTVGHALLETAERFTEVERETATQQYLLLVGALRSLSRREHDASLVLDAYLLRSLAVAGYAASFGDCARCGEAGPHAAFNVSAGGAVCPSCRPPGSAAPDPATLELLAALLSGEWALADAVEDRCRREGSGLVAAFLQWHLEHGIRSLRHVEREPHEPPVPLAR